MNKDYNIEEIKQIFADNGFEDSNGGEEIDILAHNIINAGYRKTVWHKIADGDLPVEDTLVWCYDGNGYCLCSYVNGSFIGKTEVGEKIEVNDVLFWTELPMYEES